MKIRTYSELMTFSSFKDRYQYLRLNGSIGESTFGFDRYINQKFYRSAEWKHIRNYVIVRDNGCDLGVEGYEIHEKILIHHMNPIALTDIQNASEYLLNPDYLISVALATHNAIHYGDETLLIRAPTVRRPNDTCPWKH